MYKYELIIYWSEEDESYIAEVPKIRRFTVNGSLYQKVLNSTEKVIDEWIETAKLLGRAFANTSVPIVYFIFKILF